MTAAEEFMQAMAAAGIEPHGELVLIDGQLLRFRVKGDKAGSRNGACVFYSQPGPAGWFGSWRTGASHTWRMRPPIGETAGARAERRRQLEEMRRLRSVELLRVQASARERVARLLRTARPASDGHSYLLSKGVHAYGIFQLNNMLMIPGHDVDGVIHTAQFIGPDGVKRFISGGRVEGCYFSIGRPVDCIYVTEGYATAATVFEATGAATAACFSCGNLKSVALALRAKFPELRLVIAADNDENTEGNPGVRYAFEAAAAAGALVAVPDFKVSR